MPHAGGYNTAVIDLGWRKAQKFSEPENTDHSFTDRMNVTHSVLLGTADDEEKNYGVFDNKNCLIAALELSAPSVTSSTCCPTPFWSVGIIQVVNLRQGQGIGPRLLDTVFDLHSASLASDLNQDAGGADLWKRWIAHHPGQIHLADPSGLSHTVHKTQWGYDPDPWIAHNSRLVRDPLRSERNVNAQP